MTTNEPASVSQPSLRQAVLYGTLLVTVDVFLLGQGALALLVGICMLFIALPRTFLVRKFAAVRARRLRNIAVYLVAVIAVFLLNAENNRIARDRADILVSAVKAFHAKNQRYPNSLQELVPEHIDRVPLAKYALMFNRFSYHASDQGASLFYVDLRPFGRPTYSFTRNEWGYLD